MQKRYPMQLQKLNTPTDRAQIVDTKNGGHLSICLFVMFTLRVTFIKMSKMAVFGPPALAGRVL